MGIIEDIASGVNKQTTKDINGTAQNINNNMRQLEGANQVFNNIKPSAPYYKELVDQTRALGEETQRDVDKLKEYTQEPKMRAGDSLAPWVMSVLDGLGLRNDLPNEEAYNALADELSAINYQQALDGNRTRSAQGEEIKRAMAEIKKDQ